MRTEGNKMFQVEVLTNNVEWLKKGEITELNDERTKLFEIKGYVQIIKYVGKVNK